MDRVVDRQSDGDAGNKAGYHGKLNTEPSHDSEVNNDGQQVGQDRNQAHFNGHKEDEHHPENQDHGDAQALDLPDGNLMAAGGDDDSQSGYLPLQVLGEVLFNEGQCFFAQLQKLPGT